MVKGCRHVALARLPLPRVRCGGVGCLWEWVGPVFETSFFPQGCDLLRGSRKESLRREGLCEMGPHRGLPALPVGSGVAGMLANVFKKDSL